MAKKKNYILILICLVIITTIIVTFTQAKYKSAYEANTNAAIAKWNININDKNISSNESIKEQTITLVPNANPNVAEGKMAPGDSGYFDIEINPNKTQTSFEYSIQFDTQNLPQDFEIYSYKIGELGNENTIVNNEIKNTVNLEGKQAFEETDKILIRILWRWNINDTSDGNSIQVEEAFKNKEYKINCKFIVMQAKVYNGGNT